MLELIARQTSLSPIGEKEFGGSQEAEAPLGVCGGKNVCMCIHTSMYVFMLGSQGEEGSKHYCLIHLPSLIFLERNFVLFQLYGEAAAIFIQCCPGFLTLSDSS